ncbi:putative nitrite reductase [Winogradskyella psychrotolerans RS-3]|uniref:Putative nitrite reductase n=1 Tax=Winogradskyella psychrotolerans RS-3 TaxID=641526 RepID=S7VY11_9FLAO|nr:cytochrome c [Winogradskyella psychrotolerans]EPR74312.1 putative nitrite reductase [Winogradskyella psychrotolerans RS-3]
MKNIIILGILMLTVVSCNSNTKKTNTIAQNYNTVSQDNPKLTASIERGKITYNDMCITCHLPNGEGVPRAFPPLADSDFLRENQTESIKAAKYGMSGEIVVNGITYNSTMAPLGLSDKEVADVINYINNSWGNAINNFVTPEKVSEL